MTSRVKLVGKCLTNFSYPTSFDSFFRFVDLQFTTPDAKRAKIEIPNVLMLSDVHYLCPPNIDQFCPNNLQEKLNA